MSADNKETIAKVIFLHKQKELLSIFQLSSFSLNNFDLKNSYHELTRRVHSYKNGINPDTTSAQHNLVDTYESLKRERKIEDEREREREKNRIRVQQREEKRKRENDSNKKREKEKRESEKLASM